jgi:hypothetical protein
VTAAVVSRVVSVPGCGAWGGAGRKFRQESSAAAQGCAVPNSRTWAPGTLRDPRWLHVRPRRGSTMARGGERPEARRGFSNVGAPPRSAAPVHGGTRPTSIGLARIRGDVLLEELAAS